MKELKYQQQHGQQEFVTANRDENVKIPAVEQHLVHVQYFAPQYNRETGVAEHRVRTNPFGYEEFKRMEKEGAFQGLKVRILHMPDDPSVTDLKRAQQESALRQQEIEKQKQSDDDALKAAEDALKAQKEKEEQAAKEAAAKLEAEEKAKADAASKKEQNEPPKPAKSVSSMNKAELIEYYGVIFGQDPAADATVDDLRLMIKEELDERK